MSLNSCLISLGIDWSNILDSLQEMIAFRYFDEEKMVELFYYYTY